MDSLTRFARELADRLARNGDGKGPVSVAEIRAHVLPYRLHRRALSLASVEDYETMLLRLVAEEAGHVRTEPAAAAERCREELAQPTPDLGVLEEIGDSTVQMLDSAFAREDDQPVRRKEPQEEIPHYETAELSTEGPPPAVLQHPQLCGHCSKPVPQGRPVTFCPWCGERLTPLTCSRCGAERDAAWRHCVSCGAPQ